MKFFILQTEEFKEWFGSQSPRTQVFIVARIERLQVEGHWGFVHRFAGLIELKWISGLRIYTARLGDATILILLGGNKNGQNKDIQTAQKLLKKYAEAMDSRS